MQRPQTAPNAAAHIHTRVKKTHAPPLPKKSPSQALAIGGVLSTAPLLFYDPIRGLGQRFYVVGAVFGSGEALGAVLLLLTVSEASQLLLRKYFRVGVGWAAVL